MKMLLIRLEMRVSAPTLITLLLGIHDLIIDASVKDRVRNESFSGSVALAVGIGAGLAGAGAEATTKIGTVVDAHVQNTSITALNDITITAKGDSKITDALAVGVAVAAGAGGLSVGVSIVDSNISNQINAYIQNTSGKSVTADNNVTVRANQTAANIENVEAVTASVAAGGLALLGAG